MDTATKTGLDAAKTAPKRVIQKTAKAKVIQQEIKQLIRLLLQINQKKKQKQKKNLKKFIFHQKKTQQIIDDLRLF